MIETNRDHLRRRIRRLIGSAMLLALGSCGGDPVKDLGGGKHSVTVCSDADLTNPQVKATQAADKFCRKSGEAAVVEKLDEVSCPKAAAAATTVVCMCR
jgi:hypothetical protein